MTVIDDAHDASERVVTDEHIAHMRSFIGPELGIEQYNHEASTDTIRHYAHGIGDDNPLWLDEEYARTTRYGTRIAPPTFIYGIYDAEVIKGVPPFCQPLHIGSEIEFYRPIRLGDAITAKARLADVRDKMSKSVGRLPILVGESNYWNQNDEAVARVSQLIALPVAGGTGLQYKPRAHSSSQQERDKITRDIMAEERRGATPRFWEDVNVGDSLQPVVKGPLDRMSMTVYYAGAVGSAITYKSLEIRTRFQEHLRQHPEDAPSSYDLDFLLKEVHPASGHQDGNSAAGLGMPGAYDNGNQRTAWLAHLITNWIGDDGWMTFLRSEIRRPNVQGDTLWLSGTVTEKSKDDGEFMVDIEITGINQLGEVTTGGRAVVVLPSRTAS